eukprot:CAMPEP_0185821654 /NCGR_PEP_ID=MMETSP1322-20130828/25527_1 /TAXON_ID=265543 /ORGANISM="Minutocellus polymorphus, Strain RCC2270" /LENGTH=69 /DNA_ID=CAMNT_0028519047 /DNA_START=12 /DNA_END=217 /DNA_ORIENTATION=+
MALVVAMAGMMLPAMPLALYRLWMGSILKTYWRRLAAAVTKRMAISSSLSNAGATPDAPWVDWYVWYAS